MIQPLEALADCIMQFEGWKTPSNPFFKDGSTSWRNRNPGNLRESIIAHTKDERNYCVFATLASGWNALVYDLNVKITGQSSHGLTKQSTLHDLISIYAPALDNNNPTQYSDQIAEWMSKIYNVTVTSMT